MSAASLLRTGVRVDVLDTFQGDKTAIGDKLQDAVAVLNAFHIVKPGTSAIDERRRRIQ